jgi:hypothetical protein
MDARFCTGSGNSTSSAVERPSRWLTSAKLDIHRTIAALKAAIAYLEAVLVVLERMQA